jgi:hypothetical protein
MRLGPQYLNGRSSPSVGIYGNPSGRRLPRETFQQSDKETTHDDFRGQFTYFGPELSVLPPRPPGLTVRVWRCLLPV